MKALFLAVLLSSPAVAETISAHRVVGIVNPCGGMIFNVDVGTTGDFKVNKPAPWAIKLPTAEGMTLSTPEKKDMGTFVRYVFESKECHIVEKRAWKLGYEVAAYICKKDDTECRREVLKGSLDDETMDAPRTISDDPNAWKYDERVNAKCNWRGDKSAFDKCAKSVK